MLLTPSNLNSEVQKLVPRKYKVSTFGALAQLGYLRKDEEGVYVLGNIPDGIAIRAIAEQVKELLESSVVN